MIQGTLLETIQRASFIFAGTVTQPTGTSLRELPPGPGLAVVRFERGLLVNPMLGNLVGRPITVRLAQEGARQSAVEPGQRLLFIATAWVHSDEIAVTEVARFPADEKILEEVAQLVASLPERHLAERVARAVLIVHGLVRDISRASEIPGTGSEHDPGWMRAHIEVYAVLKGEVGRKTAELLFPGSGDRAFRDVPRPSQGQSAVFLLQPAPEKLPSGSMIAPDPADIQPETQLPSIRRLIEQSGPTGPAPIP